MYHFSFWKTKRQIDVQYVKETTYLEQGKSIILKTNTHDYVVPADSTHDNEYVFTNLEECKEEAIRYRLDERQSIDIMINEIKQMKEEGK